MFSFKSILVPVDFTINTEVAVKKAIEIADRNGAVISLLHLLHPLAHLSAGSVTELERPDLDTATKMLEQWKTSIEETVSSLRVETEVVSGLSLMEAVCKKSRAVEAQLIVIGKN